MTAKEIITKFHNIGDAKLSLADTQWLIQNIDKAINEAKNSSQPEPPVPQKIAEEFEYKFVYKYILASDGWTWKNKDMHYNEIIEFINTKLREVIDDILKIIDNAKAKYSIDKWFDKDEVTEILLEIKEQIISTQPTKL